MDGEISTLLGNDIENIVRKLHETGMAVTESLCRALEALQNHRKDIAKEILVHDDIVDSQCIDIETSCFHLIATHQPVAGDLRRILSCIQIASELERIGDHIKTLANAVSTSEQPLTDHLQNKLQMMGKEIMFRHSVASESLRFLKVASRCPS